MRLSACSSATGRKEIEVGDVAECSTRLGLMLCNRTSGLVGFVLQTRCLPEEIPLQAGTGWIACHFCLEIKMSCCSVVITGTALNLEARNLEASLLKIFYFLMVLNYT